jgi:hypothetical protein
VWLGFHPKGFPQDKFCVFKVVVCASHLLLSSLFHSLTAYLDLQSNISTTSTSPHVSATSGSPSRRTKNGSRNRKKNIFLKS